ncbi:MAG: oxygen-independent coproporphyrinogen III oxidase [Trueperaceae bacterium]|nr:MAG: oxygen-independent coproporphyrinogen III oxidase [Trueperaceae bacterium]
MTDQPHHGTTTVTSELLQKHDRPGPRYTSYPTAIEFNESYGREQYRAALRAASQIEAPLSLYAHLPFCSERCLFCACNVVISPNKAVAEPYLDAIENEIALVAPLLGERRQVSQFHFGGGTPTYYRPDQLARLVGAFQALFDFLPGAELALEADPRVTSTEHLRVLGELGFNRLSLGVQDFDKRVQEAVNRVQTYAETETLVTAARGFGYRSVNIDLIYGLPFQTPARFSETLEQVVALRPDRLAIYSFALVPWMKHHQKNLPARALPEGTAKLELIVTARKALLAAGYVDIGMDHFALPGDELSKAQREGRLWRNFMGYTTSRAPDLIGFGLSAIGNVGASFAQNERKLSRYRAAVQAGELPVERGFALTKDDLMRQVVIREWMCNFRVIKADIERRFEVDFDRYFAVELGELESFQREGFLEVTESELRAEPLGKLFPRNIAMVFDAYLRSKTERRETFSRTV